MNDTVMNGSGYFRMPTEDEIRRAENDLYNARQLERAVCDYFGITVNRLYDDSEYANSFIKKYGCDLLYDVLNKKSPLYLGGQIIDKARILRRTCEEQEAWYIAAKTVLSKSFS